MQKNSIGSAQHAWTNIALSFFVGIVNCAAQQNGLDIELVRQASFGSLTPTIAPCDQSFRINVGIIPLEFVDILISCLTRLNAALILLNSKGNEEKHHDLDFRLPENNFLVTEIYKKYKTEMTKINNEEKNPASKKKQKKKPEVKQNESTPKKSRKVKPKILPTAKNILELAWAKVDTGGYSTAHNLMRTSNAHDGFSAVVYKEAAKSSIHSPTNDAQIFLNALRWGFGRMEVVKERSKLKLTYHQDTIKFEKLRKNNAKITDDAFFNCIHFICESIDKEYRSYRQLSSTQSSYTQERRLLLSYIADKTVGRLYYSLAMLIEFLHINVIENAPGDEDHDYGSDSDIEDDDEFAKKLIVQSGMRATMAALHAASEFLYPDYLKNDEKYPLFIHGAYYEVENAVKKSKKFNCINNLAKISKAEILIHDANICETSNNVHKKLTSDQLSKFKIIIIDSTSSTIAKHGKWVKLFKNQSQMQALLFVSSGLKNETLGDNNTYGTVRIFAKIKETKDQLYTLITSKQSPIKSAISHRLRIAMKKMGCTPTNRQIIGHNKSAEKKSDTLKNEARTPASSNLSLTPSLSGLFSKSLSSVVSRGGKDVSTIYWYEDTEMKSILETKLAQHQNRTQNSNPIHVLGPLDNMSPYGLIEALIDHDRKPGVVIIPFNLGRLHWVGLLLEYDFLGCLVRANYYDPQGRTSGHFLNTALAIMSRNNDTVSKWAAIQEEAGLIKQTNNSDCGPCTIENLFSAVGYRESKDTDAVQRRLNHLELLEQTGDEIFYADLYQRQRLNQSSFSKLKMVAVKKFNHPDQFSKNEYGALLLLALNILKLPEPLQSHLIRAFTLQTEQTQHINQIKNVLKDSLSDRQVIPIIKQLFYLKDEKSLNNATLRTDYNNISQVIPLLSLTSIELSADLQVLRPKENGDTQNTTKKRKVYASGEPKQDDKSETILKRGRF